MSQIVEALRNVDDADARVIAHIGSLDFTIDYIRDDLASRYSDRDLDEAYNLIMANQVSGDDFKELVGEDRYDAQTLFFENIVVLIVPSARYEAVFASFDRHDELPVNELVAVATERDR